MINKSIGKNCCDYYFACNYEGDREIDASNRKTVAVPSRDGLTTITDTLHYAFQAGDHGQTVRCITAGPWIRETDDHDTTAQLNVICKASPFHLVAPL